MSNHNINTTPRKSNIEVDVIYFWTATIREWSYLLWDNRYKTIIIHSLEYLSEKKMADVFAFVIMPNHIHFIWRMNCDNGKERTHHSFLKYTAHEFRKLLMIEGGLDRYSVDATNKSHEFWQRDSLAIPLYSREVAFQKMEYIHNNPCVERWNLAEEPQDYYFSSDRFYSQNNRSEFAFLKDLRNEF